MTRAFREGESCIECGTTERKHHARGLCVNCYARTARHENPETYREINRNHNQTEKKKKWLEEYKKTDTYKEMMKKSSKKYRDEHPDRVKKSHDKWKQKNPTANIEYSRAPETVSRQKKNALRRKYGDVAVFVLERDGGICQKCGKKEAHLHHIDWDKTNNIAENLIVLCNSCHTTTHRWIPIRLRRELFDEFMKE